MSMYMNMFVLWTRREITHECMLFVKITILIGRIHRTLIPDIKSPHYMSDEIACWWTLLVFYRPLVEKVIKQHLIKRKQKTYYQFYCSTLRCPSLKVEWCFPKQTWVFAWQNKHKNYKDCSALHLYSGEFNLKTHFIHPDKTVNSGTF